MIASRSGFACRYRGEEGWAAFLTDDRQDRRVLVSLEAGQFLADDRDDDIEEIPEGRP